MSSCSLFRHATLLHGEKKRCVTRRLSVRFAAFTKSVVIEQIVHEERTVQAQGSQRRLFQRVFTRNCFLGAQEITQRFCKMKDMEGAPRTIRNEPLITQSVFFSHAPAPHACVGRCARVRREPPQSLSQFSASLDASPGPELITWSEQLPCTRVKGVFTDQFIFRTVLAPI